MVSGLVSPTSAEAKPDMSGARDFKILEVPEAAECLRFLGVRGLTFELTPTLEAAGRKGPGLSEGLGRRIRSERTDKC